MLDYYVKEYNKHGIHSTRKSPPLSPASIWNTWDDQHEILLSIVTNLDVS